MEVKPIRLIEPPSGASFTPEISDGVANVVKRVVVIGNELLGAENQCLALVRALGLSDRQIFYRLTRPSGQVNGWIANRLPPCLHKIVYDILRHLLGGSRVGLVQQGNGDVPSIGLSLILEADSRKIAGFACETFDKEGPTLVVACGWESMSISSSIRLLAPDNVFVIQMDIPPGARINKFDMVVAPRHEYYQLTTSEDNKISHFLRRWITPQKPPGKNVVLTVGALHRADPVALSVATSAWHDELDSLPKPLLIVNIGGPTNCCNYGADLAKNLVASLHNVMKTCVSVRISFSRRTPQKVSNIIIRELGTHPKIYIWDGQDPNPHIGHLALGDAFIITADSVSMLSEACSTGKPVYVIGIEHCKRKLADFLKNLRERGVIRPFTGLEDISNTWSYTPLNDAVEVASRVREFLAERGWSIGD